MLGETKGLHAATCNSSSKIGATRTPVRRPVESLVLGHRRDPGVAATANFVLQVPR